MAIHSSILFTDNEKDANLEWVKEKCFSCNNKISGLEARDSIDVGGNRYHNDCFRCTHCLMNIEDQSILQNGHLFCSECFSGIFACSCNACTKPITFGEKVNSFDRDFHQECYKCSSCETEINDDNKAFFQGKLYCVDCEAQAVQSSTYLQCDLCRNPIYTNQKTFVTSANRKMIVHAHHFMCTICGCKLSQSSYIDEQTQICKPCHITMGFKNCGSCERVVRGRVIHFKDQTYHAECFACSNCNVDLSYKGAAKSWHNKPYCVNCYEGYIRDKCSFCLSSERAVKTLSLLGKRWCENHIFCYVCCSKIKYQKGVQYIDLNIMCDRCFQHCINKESRDFEIGTVNKMQTMLTTSKMMTVRK